MFLKVKVRAIFLVLSVVMLFSHVTKIHANSLSELYREQKFDHIVSLLEGMAPEYQNEESIYYLALSYVKQKKFDKAKHLLVGLLQKDPSFYAYRISFDLDLAELLHKTDLKKTLDLMVGQHVQFKIQKYGHQLVETSDHVFLYRNGIKQNVPVKGKVMASEFVDDDLLYVVAQQKNKKQKVYLYSGKQRRLVYSWQTKEPLGSLMVKRQGQKIMMQNKNGFTVIDALNWVGIVPWTQGRSVYINATSKKIQFMTKKTRSSVWEPQVLSY